LVSVGIQESKLSGLAVMAMDMLSKLSLKKVGIPQNGHFSNGEQDENPNLNGSFIEFCHVFSPTFCDENT
jgi:hypothetical protein